MRELAGDVGEVYEARGILVFEAVFGPLLMFAASSVFGLVTLVEEHTAGAGTAARPDGSRRSRGHLDRRGRSVNRALPQASVQ